MRKAILLMMGIFFLSMIILTSAIQPLPKGPCNWTRAGTEYRPERNFTGVYGAFVVSRFDESLNKTVYSRENRCFSPGGNSHRNIQADQTPEPTPSGNETTPGNNTQPGNETQPPSCKNICHNETLCEKHWEKTWKETCRWQCPPGKKVCNHGWVWGWHETCENKRVCLEVCS